MTREEAIDWLKAISFVSDHHITEAIDMAIEALQEVPKRRKEAKRWKRKALQADRKERAMTDLISRADAIELFEKYKPRMAVSVYEYGQALKALPSARPTAPTVIRSKTLMPTKDFDEWAKRVKEMNGDVVVIPCDAEQVSARPTGEWIFNTEENGKSWNICSVCGDSIFHKTNFCPNCGAQMLKGGGSE